MILKGKEAQYKIGEKVAETAAYRLYLCEEVASGKQCLLQIAAEVVSNGGLDRADYVLKELKRTADEFEAEYARRGSRRLLSYDRLFPILVDSFVPESQGKRRVNILAFTEVDKVSQLVPLSNLATKDRLRVDLRSSAWIMGRLLKLLGFTHGEGIAVRALSGSNILLEPAQHFAVVFDWSSSQTYQTDLPVDVRKDDIAAAGRAVYAAIGGNIETGEYLYDDGGDSKYVERLWRLTSRRESNAESAHKQFYELIEELWGRSFHPFKTLPL